MGPCAGRWARPLGKHPSAIMRNRPFNTWEDPRSHRSEWLFMNTGRCPCHLFQPGGGRPRACLLTAWIGAVPQVRIESRSAAVAGIRAEATGIVVPFPLSLLALTGYVRAKFCMHFIIAVGAQPHDERGRYFGAQVSYSQPRPTLRLSDPAPLRPVIDDQRDRGVRCRRWVRHHFCPFSPAWSALASRSGKKGSVNENVLY